MTGLIVDVQGDSRNCVMPWSGVGARRLKLNDHVIPVGGTVNFHSRPKTKSTKKIRCQAIVHGTPILVTDVLGIRFAA